LNQLDIYRASLGRDIHSVFESCTLNRELMDDKDPSICRKFDPSKSSNGIWIGGMLAALIIVSAVVVFVVSDRRTRKTLSDHLTDDGKDRKYMNISIESIPTHSLLCLYFSRIWRA
jgi:hypothetical protein